MQEFLIKRNLDNFTKLINNAALFVNKVDYFYYTSRLNEFKSFLSQEGIELEILFNTETSSTMPCIVDIIIKPIESENGGELNDL